MVLTYDCHIMTIIDHMVHKLLDVRVLADRSPLYVLYGIREEVIR